MTYLLGVDIHELPLAHLCLLLVLFPQSPQLCPQPWHFFKIVFLLILWQTNKLKFWDYTVKKVSGFLVPSRYVTYQTLPGQDNLIIPGPGEFGKWHPSRWLENRLPFFTVYMQEIKNDLKVSLTTNLLAYSLRILSSRLEKSSLFLLRSASSWFSSIANFVSISFRSSSKRPVSTPLPTCPNAYI